jgi:hypothetical protein
MRLHELLELGNVAQAEGQFWQAGSSDRNLMFSGTKAGVTARLEW